jgi:hypothetical protein
LLYGRTGLTVLTVRTLARFGRAPLLPPAQSATIRPWDRYRNAMTEFDPAKFEDKYEHYFPELQRAYRQAFETMNERYDSDLVHAIDQQVLAESEPFYEGDGEFRIELPDEPADRLSGVLVDAEKLETVLDRYVEEIEAELQSVFGL